MRGRRGKMLLEETSARVAGVSAIDRYDGFEVGGIERANALVAAGKGDGHS
jgi:hypothetical protein